MLPFLEATARAHPGWHLVAGFALPRLGRRIAAVLVSTRAVLVLGTDRADVESAALDLADFHAGCRDAPILPIHLVQGERVLAQHPLPLPGAARPMACTRLLLPLLLDQLARFPPIPALEPIAWAAAPYHPVPSLLQAAAALYAHHGDARLQLTSSTPTDLARTSSVLATLLGRRGHHIVFVTGAPGAGKTLLGLDTAFDPAYRAAFLTGNPALLHILRAALARDAAARGLPARAARQRTDAVIQPLHAFRDHHAATVDPPPDGLLVIDEAQRCWTEAYVRRKTVNRPHPLHASQPALILDAMARRRDATILCLVGGGQEIYTGEGGLAAWGDALGTRPQWQVHAPPAALDHADPRQRLPALPTLTPRSGLHLGRPIRHFRAPTLVAWADAVLADQPGAASRLAPSLPLHLTRSLPALREALRARRRPGSTAATTGLLASSGARRLRAEGLGGLLWHQDEYAVAIWFLDPWPDIRSADALELAATEFGAQGLELDHAGLCWDADLVRAGGTWQARSFRATTWTLNRKRETLSNRLNTYRVLLTRARRSLILWVPRGDPRDATRDPAQYDAIAAYLAECGATTLDPSPAIPDHLPVLEPALL